MRSLPEIVLGTGCPHHNRAYGDPRAVGNVRYEELTGQAKREDAAGVLSNWHAGEVSGKLSEGKKRQVILSRWAKPVRIVPDSEVAQKIKELLQGENVTIPANVVTPSLRRELEKIGVPVADNLSGPSKGLKQMRRRRRS